MVTPTIEAPEKKVRFSGLEELRSELRNQAKNREYLAEFEKTIDAALRENEKDGIIEFTENEWQDLITNENLPPLAQVKELLASKINAMREVTAETKEQTGGLAEEFTAKVQEVKTTVTKKVDETKEKITAGITEALSPIQKIKDSFVAMGTKMGEFFSEIGSTIKFLFFTLGAALGLKGAKEALAAMAKEKAEKVVDAAKEKAGEIGKGEEKTAEGKEDIGEKVGPIAMLSTAGLGIFTLLKAKNILPTSVTDKIDTTDKKGFLLKLATNRALKLFGVGGIALYGLGKLGGYIEENAAELGDIPTNEAGKKAWWEKAMAGAKIVNQDILDIVTGKKTVEKMQETNREGYVALKDHEMVRGAKIEMEIVENRLVGMYHQDPNKFRAAIGTILGTNAPLALGIIAKGGSILAALLKFGIVGHPVALGLGIVAGVNGIEAIKNIEVRADMTEGEITEMVTDMSFLNEVNIHLTNYSTEGLQDHAATIGRKLTNGGAELKADIEYFWDNLSSNIEKGIIEGIGEDDAEKICDVDEHGLSKLRSEIVEIVLQKNKAQQNSENFEEYERLIGIDGKGGILGTIISKVSKKEFLGESDIHDLMAATIGTDIRIFPEGGSREGQTIQWVQLNENGSPIGLAKNICVNPLLSTLEKRAVAREFVYNPNQIDIGGTLASKGFEGTRELATKLVNSISSKPDEAKNILEKMLGDKLGGFMNFGATAYFVDYLGNKYLLGPTTLFEGILGGLTGNDLEVTEALVDYAQGLAPVFIITGIKNFMKGDRIVGRGLTGNILVETLAYPYKGSKGVYRGAKLIYERMKSGDLAGILRDPAVILRDGIVGRVQHLSGKGLSTLAGMKHAGERIELQGKLKEFNAKLNRLKILRDIGAESSRDAYRIIDEIKDYILKAKNEDLARELGIGVDSIKMSDLDDLLRKTNDALGRVTVEIGKITPELKEKIRKAPSLLTGVDVPATKTDAIVARREVQERIDQLEAEKQKMLKQHKERKITDAQWKSIKRAFSRRTTQLIHFEEQLRIHIEGHPTHGHVEGKWKGRARGIIGLAALVTIMVGVSKLRTDQPGLEIPELDIIDEGQIDFFGFGSKDDLSEESQLDGTLEQEKKNEAGQDKQIDINETPAYIRPFMETMQDIKGMYGTEFEFLCDPEALKNASDETIQSKVDNLTNIHEQMILDVKDTIKVNRVHIKRYFQESKEKDFMKLSKGDLNAFFGLNEKNDKISLEYMDSGDFSTTIWEMADFNKDNADEILSGDYNGWDQVWYVTKRAAPLSSEYYDGRDMIRNFGRGKIANGFKSMGWLAFGTLCDVGMIFSFGTTGFGKLGNAARAGLQWARLGKVLELIKISRAAVESGKLGGKVMGQILSKSITHSGTLMLGQMGADVGHQTIVFPRSESISIDDL